MRAVTSVRWPEFVAYYMRPTGTRKLTTTER